MVDIHCHILCGLDDGAKTLDESIAMVKIAAETGTTDLVATPHADLRHKYDEQTVLERIEQLVSATGGVLNLYPGCDFHMTMENVQDAVLHPARYAINKRNYVLVEMPDQSIPASMGTILQDLLAAGMTPIVTHPERNVHLQKMKETLADWVRGGCLMQVTAGSFLGRFGRKATEFSLQLLDGNMVHFVASDGHDTTHRPPRLDEARAFLAGRNGASVAELLTEHNPRAALLGERIDAGRPERPRKWFSSLLGG